MIHASGHSPAVTVAVLFVLVFHTAGNAVPRSLVAMGRLSALDLDGMTQVWHPGPKTKT